MKKYLVAIVCYSISNLSFGQLQRNVTTTNEVVDFTQSDINYLTKGFWELASNGYQARTDLTLKKTSSYKSSISSAFSTFMDFRYFQICKNGKNIGVLMTGSLNKTSVSSSDFIVIFPKCPTSEITNYNQTQYTKFSAYSSTILKATQFVIIDVDEFSGCTSTTNDMTTNTNSQVQTIQTGTYQFSNDAMSGTLLITSVTPQNFNFKLQIATQSCTGEISGVATITGQSATYSPSNGGLLGFTLNNNSITVNELTDLSYYHGATCRFVGVYKKQ